MTTDIRKASKPESLTAMIRGFSDTAWTADIELRFEQSKEVGYHPDEIDKAKLKKALGIVSDCQYGIKIEVHGRGEQVEGFTRNYTTVYDVSIEREEYKGMQFFTVVNNLQRDENGLRKHKAHGTFEEASKAVLKELTATLSASELIFEYTEKRKPQEQEQAV